MSYDDERPADWSTYDRIATAAAHAVVDVGEVLYVRAGRHGVTALAEEDCMKLDLLAKELPT